MKRLLVILVAVLLSCAGNEAYCQCMPLRPLSESTYPFKAGENLSYRIRFKWGAINSDVALATMSIDRTTLNGKPVYSARVFGQTAKFYDNFFKLREDFRSWMSVADLQPQRFFRDTREGRYRCTNDFKFVWNAAEPYVDAQIETSRKPKYGLQIPVDGCTFDPVSLFYTARNMDMTMVKPGVENPMTFVVADESYTVFFVYKGKEEKNIKGFGTVKTMKFSVQVVEGDVFTGDSDMLIWFSDDDNRIPVYFEAPLKIGMVSGRIETAEGLKYPFRSLVQKN